MNKCPYCGADTRVNYWRKKIGKATPTLLETAQIKCKRQSCGMSGPLFKGDGCKKRAMDHWGRCAFMNTKVA